MTDPNWELSNDDKKERIKVFSKTGNSGLNSVKSEGIVDFPADLIFKFLVHNKYRNSYNKVLSDTDEQLMKVGA